MSTLSFVVRWWSLLVNLNKCKVEEWSQYDNHQRKKVSHSWWSRGQEGAFLCFADTTLINMGLFGGCCCWLVTPTMDSLLLYVVHGWAFPVPLWPLVFSLSLVVQRKRKRRRRYMECLSVHIPDKVTLTLVPYSVKLSRVPYDGLSLDTWWSQVEIDRVSISVWSDEIERSLRFI